MGCRPVDNFLACEILVDPVEFSECALWITQESVKWRGYDNRAGRDLLQKPLNRRVNLGFVFSSDPLWHQAGVVIETQFE